MNFSIHSTSIIVAGWDIVKRYLSFLIKKMRCFKTYKFFIATINVFFNEMIVFPDAETEKASLRVQRGLSVTVRWNGCGDRLR